MGEVYIAKDESLERSVALKVLPPRLVRNEERVRRFVTEAKSASSLNHPNIVTIYEIGQDRIRGSDAGDGASAHADPVHFISMELVAGETLSQKIYEDKTDLRTILGFLAQAADGIAKAHAAGIVHRDLKPGNIMISKDGFAKVLDFGLAKLTEKQAAADPDLTSAPTEVAATGEGVILGTAGYMSPEQVQGKTVDHRSDIFSMGCILYEAAARKRPFVADTDIEVMHQILRDRPTPVEEMNPQVPGEVRRLIRRCLAKSPDQRFQSMKDLALELREVVDEYDTLAVATSTAVTAHSLPSGALGAPRQSRAATLLFAALGILGVAGGGFGLYSWWSGASAGAAAVRLQDVQMSVLMNRDDLNEAVLSSDGRYLAFVTTASGKSSLNVRQVRTGSDAVILPPQEYPIHGIRFSPDGDYIYFLNQDPGTPAYNALFQVASLGGTPRKIFFDVDTAPGPSPDGTRVCFRRNMPDRKTDTLVVGDLATRTERELIRISHPDNFVASPAWSADGKRIATAIQGPTNGFRSWVAVIDVESGKRVDIAPRNFIFIGDVGWMPDGEALVASAFAVGSTAPQIYRLSFPGGDVLRLTNDLNGYAGLSLSGDGKSVAAVRSTDVINVWRAEVDGAKRDPIAITTATSSSGSADNPIALGDGGIVFEGSEGARVQLWRADADGSNRRRLTSDGITVFGARFAGPSGVIFTQIGDDTIAHVYRMDPDGAALRQLTSGGGEQLEAVSRDGKYLLFSRWNEAQKLWVMNASGAGEPRLFASDVNGDNPDIAPDGKLARFGQFTDRQGRLYQKQVVQALDSDTRVAEFLLPPGAVLSLWSPDGRSMTFIDRNQGWNLMQQPLKDAEPAALTHFKEGQVTAFQWAPDGSQLALVRRIGEKDGLWLLEPGKGEPRLVSEYRSGDIRRIGWTPDSKAVVYSYGTSSQDVVLIRQSQ